MYTLENNILTIKEGSRIEQMQFCDNRDIRQVHIEGRAYIGVSAFEGCIGITEVSIAEGVTIGFCAFGDCYSITEVSIAEGVTIGVYAFLGCNGITEVSIPKGVTIDERAFEDCSGITEVSIAEGVRIGDGAFRGCSGITQLYQGVSISQLACNIKQVSSKAVDIAKIVQEMNTYKFLASMGKPVGLSIFYRTWGNISRDYHKLEKTVRERVLITLLSLYRLRNSATLPPLPLADILPFIFKPVVENRCDYASIEPTVERDRRVVAVKMWMGYINMYILENNILTIKEGARIKPQQFYNNLDIRQVHIEGKAYIGARAFAGCRGITEVSISEGVTIRVGAFEGCRRITEVSIPKGVTIGFCAFAGCRGITKVSISEGVAIGNLAFEGCSSITEVSISEGVTISGGAFRNYSGITQLYLGVSISQLAENIKQVSSKAVDIALKAKDIAKIVQDMDTYKFLASMGKPLGLSIFYRTWGNISRDYHKLEKTVRERVLITLLSLYRLRNSATLPPLPLADILPFIFKPVVENRCDYASIEPTVERDRRVVAVKMWI